MDSLNDTVTFSGGVVGAAGIKEKEGEGSQVDGCKDTVGCWKMSYSSFRKHTVFPTAFTISSR